MFMENRKWEIYSEGALLCLALVTQRLSQLKRLSVAGLDSSKLCILVKLKLCREGVGVVTLAGKSCSVSESWSHH